MGKLIKFEFRKIFQQKSLYICFGLAVLSATLNIVMFKSVLKNVNISSHEIILDAMKYSLFTLLISVNISLYSCNDFSNSTLKNICSKGFSRVRIYMSKYIVSASVTLMCSILIMLLTAVLSPFIGAETVDKPGRLIILLLSQLIVILGYHGVYFGISSMIASSGISIAVNIVGPTLLFSILSIILSVLKISSIHITEYWLEHSLTTVSTYTAKNSDIIKAIILSVVYIAVFNTAGCLINRKRQL